MSALGGRRPLPYGSKAITNLCSVLGRSSMITATQASMLIAAAFSTNAFVKLPAAPLTPRAAYDLQTQRVEEFFRTRTQDEAALRSIYTRDAILVEADGNIIRGRDAIARHFKQILASGAVASFKVTTVTFRTEGSISYAGGYEDIEENRANGSQHSRNRFFDLLRRGPDGVWRFDYIMEAR
jgi:uncharacterized protein (TIGR02246 family)